MAKRQCTKCRKSLPHKVKCLGHLKTPYDKYRSLPLWELIAKGIDELIENNDLELTTHEDYVIGYLVKKIEGNK